MLNPYREGASTLWPSASSSPRDPTDRKRQLRRKKTIDHRGSPTRDRPSRSVQESGVSARPACSKIPRRPRPLESDESTEDSQRQEASLLEAHTPRKVVPKGPTSAETAGNARETLSRGVQGGEARGIRKKEVQQEGGISKELLPLEGEINPLKKQHGERARGRSMVMHREAALRQQQDRDSKRQDSAASAGRKSRGKELRKVVRKPPRLTENLQRKANLGSSRRERRRLQGRACSWQQKQGKERRLGPSKRNRG